jgi:hypothetical protein
MEFSPATERRRTGDQRHLLGWRRHRARRPVGRGTLIRHARRDELEPGAVGALVIAMVEPAQLTGLVAGPGRP